MQKLRKIPLGGILGEFWDIFGIFLGIFWFLGYFQHYIFFSLRQNRA
jgi:hypothetical protein